MDPVLVGWLSIPALVVLIGIGMPVAYAMLVLGFVGYFLAAGPSAALANLAVVPYSSVAVYTFSVVPLFILMGNLVHRAGFGEEIFWATRQWLGRFPGGLAMATVLGCTIFGGISGSSVADAVTFGKIAVPEMRRFKYDRSFAAATVASAGPIAAMTPPSVLMVLFAMVNDQSIGKLLMAGYVPALMSAAIIMLTIALLALRNPHLAPGVPGASLGDCVRSVTHIWSVALIGLVIAGGIYLGVFTPTEAAGCGAITALLVGLGHRRLKLPAIWDALLDTTRVSGMIFAIVLGAFAYNYLIARTGLPALAGQFIGTLPFPPFVIMIAIMIFYLILGCFMDTIAMLFLTMPVIFPIVVAQGFNPIWFGILFIQNAEIGMITPPFGITLFATRSVTPDMTVTDIVKGITPFIAAGLFALVMLMIFPQIALFLPSLMHLK